jgi:hypothetical protein
MEKVYSKKQGMNVRPETEWILRWNEVLWAGDPVRRAVAHCVLAGL